MENSLGYATLQVYFHLVYVSRIGITSNLKNTSYLTKYQNIFSLACQLEAELKERLSAKEADF